MIHILRSLVELCGHRSYVEITMDVLKAALAEIDLPATVHEWMGRFNKRPHHSPYGTWVWYESDAPVNSLPPVILRLMGPGQSVSFVSEANAIEALRRALLKLKLIRQPLPTFEEWLGERKPDCTWSPLALEADVYEGMKGRCFANEAKALEALKLQLVILGKISE